MPTWIKVLGITVLVLAVLIAVLLISGIGGEHGPGRHTAASTQTAEVKLGGSR
ncbi:hypothetical protein L3Q67_32760 [Saccharothrix sp. AJ9571]|nr:hypothetical protein L3Q67_32760 [Saccharothrix sp. AJ9571]